MFYRGQEPQRIVKDVQEFQVMSPWNTNQNKGDMAYSRVYFPSEVKKPQDKDHTQPWLWKSEFKKLGKSSEALY